MGHEKDGLVRSKRSAEENRDSVSLDPSSSRSIDKDSTPPAWKEIVSRLFLFFIFNAGNVSDLGRGAG